MYTCVKPRPYGKPMQYYNVCVFFVTLSEYDQCLATKITQKYTIREADRRIGSRDAKLISDPLVPVYTALHRSSGRMTRTIACKFHAADAG